MLYTLIQIVINISIARILIQMHWLFMHQKYLFFVTFNVFMIIFICHVKNIFFFNTYKPTYCLQCYKVIDYNDIIIYNK